MLLKTINTVNTMLHADKSHRITNIRREYKYNSLRRQDLPSEPLVLFNHWLKQACEAKLVDPTAMVISTVDQNRQPWQRIVLLKHYDQKGLVFYTNLSSRKARHIAYNASVSLLFPWHVLERQIIISGKAERLSTIEVIKYFYSRPRNSQISVWASKQSSKIMTRRVLDNRFQKLKRKFENNKIPFPYFWGGFRVSAEQIEFWQGGKYRLHDRFIYRRSNNIWIIDRLAP